MLKILNEQPILQHIVVILKRWATLNYYGTTQHCSTCILSFKKTGKETIYFNLQTEKNKEYDK